MSDVAGVVLSGLSVSGLFVDSLAAVNVISEVRRLRAKGAPLHNPVKHGYVSKVAHWPHSTFHRWVKTRSYSHDWGGEGPLDVAAGERSR